MLAQVGTIAGFAALGALGGAAAAYTNDLYSGDAGSAGPMYLFAPATALTSTLLGVGRAGQLGAEPFGAAGQLGGGGLALGAVAAGWLGYQALTD